MKRAEGSLRQRRAKWRRLAGRGGKGRNGGRRGKGQGVEKNKFSTETKISVKERGGQEKTNTKIVGKTSGGGKTRGSE